MQDILLILLLMGVCYLVLTTLEYIFIIKLPKKFLMSILGVDVVYTLGLLTIYLMLSGYSWYMMGIFTVSWLFVLRLRIDNLKEAQQWLAKKGK